MTDNDLAKKLLDELVPHLELLEAQSTAILQFLKENEIAGDEQLAPYLDQAESASNVKWRATRLRIEYLLASAATGKEKPVEGTLQKPPKAEGEEDEQAQANVESRSQPDAKQKPSVEEQAEQRETQKTAQQEVAQQKVEDENIPQKQISAKEEAKAESSEQEKSEAA